MLLFRLGIAVICIFTLMSAAYALDPDEVERPEDVCKIVYGFSGTGRELTAYRFGEGENVLVVGFAIHGYEDHFKKDGGALVDTANRLMKLLAANRRVMEEYGWTVYILPCMNPDGLVDGYTCNGPGRCTTTRLNSDGVLVKGWGTDINRSFPAGWERLRNARNNNGTKPLASPEAMSLAAFIEGVCGTATNLLIDVHGWLEQTFTSNGAQSRLFRVFRSRFPANTYSDFSNSSGYFAKYAATIGYTSCLFEFPADIYSMEDFRNSGCGDRFNGCILDLLLAYGKQENNPYLEAIPWAWYNMAASARTDQPQDAVPFLDLVPGAWYADALCWAQKQGIIDRPTGLFLPSAALTERQRMEIFKQYPLSLK